MPQSGRFYPAGMLPFDDIRRLMPNFYLDVDKMMPYRHYPKHDFKRTDDTEMLIAQIQSRLSDNIRSVAREHDTYLSLTAGRDSRMLLAAARDGVARAEFFTYDDAKETVDLHVAKKIAAKYKLSWRALPATHSSPEALNQWQVDVGHCVAGAIWRHSPSFAQLGPGRVRMPGLGGEIGRCFYWRPHDRADSTLSPVDLLARMKLPTDDMSLWNMETWIKSIPAWLNAYDVLDLAYIEHRLGCWAGPALYGSDQYFAGQLVPFGDRYIIERMLSLPPEYRLQQGMARDIIRQAWPELLELLFNRYTGIRRYCSRHGMRSYARQLKRAMQRR
jgi:hypothetical protein